MGLSERRRGGHHAVCYGWQAMDTAFVERLRRAAEQIFRERDLLARYHDYKDAFHRMHEIRLRELARSGR